jgi:hypothetical protein
MSNDECPKCGSSRVVSLTPTVPGPTGWGFRCRECRHEWNLEEMVKSGGARISAPVTDPEV